MSLPMMVITTRSYTSVNARRRASIYFSPSKRLTRLSPRTMERRLHHEAAAKTTAEQEHRPAWQNALEAKDTDDTALRQRQAAHGCAMMERLLEEIAELRPPRRTARKEPNSPPQRQQREAFSVPGTYRSHTASRPLDIVPATTRAIANPAGPAARCERSPGQSNSSQNHSRRRSLGDCATGPQSSPPDRNKRPQRQIFHDFASPHDSRFATPSIAPLYANRG